MVATGAGRRREAPPFACAARLLLALTAILLPTAPSSSSAAVDVPALRVVLLGTGGPELTPTREGAATLVEAGTQTLLFDAGRGVLQRAYEARVDPRRIGTVFLTHLHSDHIEGLPGLWLTPWFLLGRSAPIAVYGPPGTAAMVAGMRAMYAHDVTARANAFNPAAGLAIDVHEIRAGVVFDTDGVRVTAFPVEHADGDPALGYRIERSGHAVVLSGDTAPVASVIAAARGADLLVHNVVALAPPLATLPEMRGVIAKLTTPEQAAAIFTTAHPRLAVYAHVVKKGMPGTAGDAAILRRTRAAGYSGRLAMGVDGMTILVGERVRVLPPRGRAGLPELDGKRATFGRE